MSSSPQVVDLGKLWFSNKGHAIAGSGLVPGCLQELASLPPLQSLEQLGPGIMEEAGLGSESLSSCFEQPV